MIEESLLKSNFIGKDGFIWWIGQVADPSVWRNEKSDFANKKGDSSQESWAYRCKVRIVGYHSFSRNELPDSDLPWAHILTSAAEGSPGQGGFGKTHSLIGGESVFGFFLDGDEAQQPVIMSCFHRSPAVVNVDNPDPFEPFTGFKGPFSRSSGSQATRQKPQPAAPINSIPTSFGSGPQVTISSNPNFGTANPASLDVSPGFAPLGNNQSLNAGANYGLSSTIGFGANPDTLFYSTKAELTFFHQFDIQPEVTGDNGCNNNIIAQITATLQNFIKFINSLESTAYGFIDPLRNKSINMSFHICKIARIIASLVKYIITGVRDKIMNLIGCLFKILGLTLPQPIKLPISEATKNIMNIIFCLFEKLFPLIEKYICSMLNGLVGRTPNIPECASQEIIAGIIAKLADMMDGALGSVVSGLDWLANGIGNIAGALTQGLGFISQILSFLGCDGLSCQGATGWDPFKGVKLPNTDNWRRTIDNFDIISALGLDEDGGIDTAIGLLSVYGSSNTPFRDCRNTIITPGDQGNAPITPIGTTYPRCIPPEIIISGGGGTGARAQAVISNVNGSILSIEILNAGRGYERSPTITVLDNTRSGTGAVARATINSTGQITSIYLVERGSGYCQTDLNNIPNPGVGTTATPGIGTTSGNLGISTAAVGIVTSIAIDSPGIGYTNGDLISIGDCTYTPIVSANGSILAISGSSCIQEFSEVPDVEINSRTGEGAALYPVIAFTPQYVFDNSNIRRVGIGTTIVSVVQCV